MKKTPKQIFDSNNVIKEFLVQTKLTEVETSVEEVLRRLSTINHKLSMIENYIDTHSVQKINELVDRIDSLETFEDRLREAL